MPSIIPPDEDGYLAHPYVEKDAPIGKTWDSFGIAELAEREGLTDEEVALAERAAECCIRRRRWRGDHGERFEGPSADDVIAAEVEDRKRRRILLEAALLIANETDDIRQWNRKRENKHMGKSA